MAATHKQKFMQVFKRKGRLILSCDLLKIFVEEDITAVGFEEQVYDPDQTETEDWECQALKIA